MSKTTKSFQEVEKSLKKLAKHAKSEIPAELKDNWNKAIAGVDANAISQAGANLVSTVTGDSRIAKRTRSSVEDAVTRAQKALISEQKKRCGGGGKFLLVLAVAGLAVAAAILAGKKTAAN